MSVSACRRRSPGRAAPAIMGPGDHREVPTVSGDEDWLVHDHRRFDEALARAQEAAEYGAWDEALRLFTELLEALALHMRLEDEVVYPALERETGDPAGELAGLRDEHRQLESLMEGARAVARERDIDHLLESLVPLRRALHEHARYEEEALARLGGEALTRNREAVLAALSALERDTAPPGGTRPPRG